MNRPLANQAKKGLARAFTKFNEYSLAKYSCKDKEFSLKDVLFLSHAKPLDKAQADMWKRLVNGQLETPDTWETALSASNGEVKKDIWERLLSENKMGAMAILKNLRNFKDSGVNEDLIINSIQNMNTERVLPFRFISAAKYYPFLEGVLEKSMTKSLNGRDKLNGRTALAIDVSGSMDMHKISAKSELTRTDAACALAIILKEQCEKVDIYTFSNICVEIPDRRGFALRDAICGSQDHRNTLIGSTIQTINQKGYERVIVLTDGQIQDQLGQVNCNNKFMLNVANYQNGIGYKDGWTNIDGFSESIVNYLAQLDKDQLQP